MRMDLPIWFWAGLVGVRFWGVMVGLSDLTNHTLQFTLCGMSSERELSGSSPGRVNVKDTE
jgi:hypothetical protein